MKYIANNKTEQAIIYDESQVTEAEAREIIGSDYPARDGSKWEEFNILGYGKTRKAYQIVDFEGAAEEDPEEEDWIDPIWYCYQYREGEINYDEGSWNLEKAIEDARKGSVDMTVWHVGLRESIEYDKTELEPLYHHEIESYDELLEFIGQRKDDKKAHYYFGFMECFNGEFYAIEDLKKDADPSWFDDDSPVDVYEW